MSATDGKPKPLDVPEKKDVHHLMVNPNSPSVVPRPTWDQVKTDERIMNAFRYHLGEKYAEENLDFLDAAVEFKEVKEKSTLAQAQEIVSKYIDENSDVTIKVSEDQRLAIEKRLTLWKGEGKEALDLFDHAAKAVQQYIEKDLLPRFFDDHDEFNPLSPRYGGGASGAKGGGGGGGEDGDGWEWTDEFEFVNVDVLGTRDLYIADASVYVQVSVDSKTIKTPVANNPVKWAEGQQHYKFPVLPTTRYVVFEVFQSRALKSDKCLGRYQLPIKDVISQSVESDGLGPAPAHSSGPLAPASPSGSSASAAFSGPALTLSIPAASSPPRSVSPRMAGGQGSPGGAVGVAPPVSPRIKMHPVHSHTPHAPSADDGVPAALQMSEAIAGWFDLESVKSTRPKKGAIHVTVRLGRGDDSASEARGRHVSNADTTFMGNLVRRAVSKKKKRFQADGFDLDLSYVTPRIIAMGFPSISIEGVYRNHVSTIKKFFATRHKNSYKVYNLCSERNYDPKLFDGSVSRFPFDDHNACPFELLPAFCDDVDNWLNQHPQNVAAIHCKAGKGRTGLVICAYMIHNGQFENAKNALSFYAAQRTKNKKGVTIPSQIRYVHYYERFWHDQRRRTALLAEGKSDKDLASVEPPLLPDGDNSGVYLKAVRINTIPAGVKTINGVLFKCTNYQDTHPSKSAKLDDAFRVFEFSSKGFFATKKGDDSSKPCIEFVLKPTKHKGGRAKDKEKEKDETKDKTPATPVAASVAASASSASASAAPVAAVSSASTPGPAEGVVRSREFSKPVRTTPNDMLIDDVRFIFYVKTTFGKDKLFQCWVNTRFLDQKTHKVTLVKDELDKAAKDKHHKHYAADLSLELEFETATERIARISLEKERADQQGSDHDSLKKKKDKKKDAVAPGGGVGGVGDMESDDEVDIMDILSGRKDSDAQGNDGVWD